MRARALILAASLLSAVAVTATGTRAAFHFALSRSVPAADATVTSPAEVRLWFTEAAAAGSVTIRLVNPGGQPVTTGATDVAEDDARVYHVAVPTKLAAGAYTVSWRGVGSDGHPVSGDFKFAVSAE
jgi:methionine-rich copper-binding protein CopC